MTAAEHVVARLDAYTQEQHAAALDAANKRIDGRRAIRRERARIAADRLRRDHA